LNAELIDALRAELAARGDPRRAPDMQRYMKSAMPYRGVTTPVLREICHKVLPAYPLESFAEWHDSVVELWDAAAYREERYAALEIVGQRVYAGFRTLQALPLYTRLIVSGAWWDLVDGLATREVGDLLRGDPLFMREQLLAWSQGDDIWLRRTSIICQVGFKRATDRELLYACIEPSRYERGFFLRKAIGWALREYGKVEPHAVAAYVAAHPELSPLSRREAMKYAGAHDLSRD
jgi:3-methyladenine DNA glycosylase AlkD